MGWYDKMIETKALFLLVSLHCFGTIWKLTVFTNFWLTALRNSQKVVKSMSFQILPKQWKQWKHFRGLNHFVNICSERIEVKDRG